MKSKYFKCICGCGVLNMEYDPDWGLEIAMFERNISRSWWNRIRLAWSALRGKPYTDMINLNEQQIADLAEFLFQVQNYEHSNKRSIYSIVEKLHEYDRKEVIDGIVEYIKQSPSNTHRQEILTELKSLQY